MNIREVDAAPYLGILTASSSGEGSFVLRDRVVVVLEDGDRWRAFEQADLPDERAVAYAAIYLLSTIRRNLRDLSGLLTPRAPAQPTLAFDQAAAAVEVAGHRFTPQA
jgi:hypothetical protein